MSHVTDPDVSMGVFSIKWNTKYTLMTITVMKNVYHIKLEHGPLGSLCMLIRPCKISNIVADKESMDIRVPSCTNTLKRIPSINN